MINSSARNVFVFGDFNTHHKDWLTYSGGTDRSCELCYNFAISNDLLTQMVNFPAWIPDSHRLALLDLFISSDTVICSTMAFPQLGNSDHVVVSVPIDFTINKQMNMQDCWPFTCWFSWTLGSLWKCGIILADVLQNWLNWSHFLFLKEGWLVILIDCMIFLSLFLDVTRMSMSTIYFLAQLDSGILSL